MHMLPRRSPPIADRPPRRTRRRRAAFLFTRISARRPQHLTPDCQSRLVRSPALFIHDREHHLDKKEAAARARDHPHLPSLAPGNPIRQAAMLSSKCSAQRAAAASRARCVSVSAVGKPVDAGAARRSYRSARHWGRASIHTTKNRPMAPVASSLSRARPTSSPNEAPDDKPRRWPPCEPCTPIGPH